MLTCSGLIASQVFADYMLDKSGRLVMRSALNWTGSSNRACMSGMRKVKKVATLRDCEPPL